MATAKHRAIDRIRRDANLVRKYEQIGRDLLAREAPGPDDLEARMDADVGDDLLALIFTACHPALSTDARVALTLKVVGALSTEEIARAFLLPVPTMAQRIVRAKRVRGPRARRAH